jgi:hypothetical protein
MEAATTMSVSAFPLAWPQGWPRTQHRRHAKFAKGERVVRADNPQIAWMTKRDLTIAEATKRVIYELSRLGAMQGRTVISSNLEINRDGLPRSGQKEPIDPGVAVYWRRGEEKVMKVMAIDRYDRAADNLAAIAATLEAMRAIERHGGGQILERAFSGFTALPAPKSCWDILGMKPTTDIDEIDKRFRDLAKKHHPDLGGDSGRMAEISHARDEAVSLSF